MAWMACITIVRWSKLHECFIGALIIALDRHQNSKKKLERILTCMVLRVLRGGLADLNEANLFRCDMHLCHHVSLAGA
jgi:hypothetical protein